MGLFAGYGCKHGAPAADKPVQQYSHAISLLPQERI